MGQLDAEKLAASILLYVFNIGSQHPPWEKDHDNFLSSELIIRRLTSQILLFDVVKTAGV